MHTKLIGIALFALTLGAALAYPQLQARFVTAGTHLTPATVTAIEPIHTPGRKPQVDVVFVLDTTGSMSGLIQTAKDKIWSIASTMASAQPTPEIRVGLVAFRDRGDQYVTRVVDLSSDLDSVYATLMEFQADGGGDTPESVNRALYDAPHVLERCETGLPRRVPGRRRPAAHGLQRSSLSRDRRRRTPEGHRRQHDPVRRGADGGGALERHRQSRRRRFPAG
jgi:Mg-chelatase subunit ChlD